MTETTPMNAPDDPRCAASGRPVDRRAASAPVEHVRAHCPTLIATLVAMARASKDGQDVDDSAAAAASRGSPGAPGISRQWPSRLAAARWQELLGDPPPDRRRHPRPTRKAR